MPSAAGDPGRARRRADVAAGFDVARLVRDPRRESIRLGRLVLHRVGGGGADRDPVGSAVRHLLGALGYLLTRVTPVRTRSGMRTLPAAVGPARARLMGAGRSRRFGAHLTLRELAVGADLDVSLRLSGPPAVRRRVVGLTLIDPAHPSGPWRSVPTTVLADADGVSLVGSLPPDCVGASRPGWWLGVTDGADVIPVAVPDRRRVAGRARVRVDRRHRLWVSGHRPAATIAHRVHVGPSTVTVSWEIPGAERSGLHLRRGSGETREVDAAPGPGGPGAFRVELDVADLVRGARADWAIRILGADGGARPLAWPGEVSMAGLAAFPTVRLHPPVGTAGTAGTARTATPYYTPAHELALRITSGPAPG